MKAPPPSKLDKTTSAPTLRLALAVLLLAGAGAAGLWWWKKKNAPVQARTLRIEIGGQSLNIPELLIREPEHRMPGRTNRLNLAVNWPDFSPLTLAKPSGNDTAMRRQFVFIAIEAADAQPDPAQRPTDLYSRFLTNEVNSSPGNLVTRSFKPESPYGGEILHIAPPSGEVFSARCLSGVTVESRAESCLWLYRTNGLDIQVRFPADALPEWETLNQNTRQLVDRIQGKHPEKNPDVVPVSPVEQLGNPLHSGGGKATPGGG